MSRRFVLTPVVIAAAGIAAAGCGSSSSKSTASTAASKPAATTPPTPPTPNTGTGTSVMPSNVMGSSGSSVPLSSPALKTALTARFAQDKRIPTKFDAPLADCLLKKLQGHGYKTVGDAQAHSSVLKADAVACATQLAKGP